LTTIAIAQADPGRSYRVHAAAIDAAVSRVLRRGRYVLGEEVESFEREFAAWVGARFAVGVGSGTDALAIALRAAGIGEGDEVVTVSHTATATIAAIEMAGALPVLVDVDRSTMTMAPGEIGVVSGPRTRAVVPVHLYGQPAAMEAIRDIAAQRGLVVVEDACQAHGAEVLGRKVGTIGVAGAFSFYPTKNLGAFGDGGAITTNDEAVADAARRLRQYGWDGHRSAQVAGVNSRLDELQAAVLRVKLRHLSEAMERRRAIAARYSRAWAGIGIALPEERPGCVHAFHLYVVRTGQRASLAQALARRGIGTAVHYGLAAHQQPAYAERLRHGSLAATERAVPQVLSLPLYPELEDVEVEHVVAAVGECARALSRAQP
jgi:dTDP-4-amino-4,6-dideoxygalactose transaminase